MPDALPVPIPGKVVQIVAMYDAGANAEDLWCLTDAGTVWHLWFRANQGWAHEPLTRPA